MEGDRTKRRRIIISQCAPGIEQLPDILLIKVAGYLPKTSRALLVVALTTDSSRWRNVNWNQTRLLSWLKTSTPKTQPTLEMKTILRMDKWDVIDFSDCGSSLASKLSDDDIAAVLSCINAVKHLKKLKLADCIGITGRGLQPLFGSVVLEWFDASLLHTPLKSKNNMCEMALLPVVDSIINTHGNSLTYFDSPWSFWTNDFHMGEFSERYRQHLEDRVFQCTKCCKTHNCNGGDDDPIDHVQDHACSECLNFFCSDNDFPDCEAKVKSCAGCDKRTCSACVPFVECEFCSEDYCKKCRKQMQCEICQGKFCEECHVTCDHCQRKGCIVCIDFMQCQFGGCEKKHCGDCYEEGTDRDVKDCESQDRFCSRHCSSCRFASCSKNWNQAPECCLSLIGISKAAAAKLQEEKDKSNDEANKLAVDNCRLKEEVNRLTKENNALSNRISIATSVLGSNQASVLSTAIISSLGNN